MSDIRLCSCLDKKVLTSEITVPRGNSDIVSHLDDSNFDFISKYSLDDKLTYEETGSQSPSSASYISDISCVDMSSQTGQWSVSCDVADSSFSTAASNVDVDIGHTTNDESKVDISLDFDADIDREQDILLEIDNDKVVDNNIPPEYNSQNFDCFDKVCNDSFDTAVVKQLEYYKQKYAAGCSSHVVVDVDVPLISDCFGGRKSKSV